jgi:hypothetical protein
MADAERLVNMFVEKNETPNAPSPYCLLPTPGFELLLTVAEGPIRGILAEVNDRVFFVAGFRLYEAFVTAGVWSAVARGVVASDANPATLCWNGPNGGELFLTSGDVGYILTLASNTLTVVLASGATMGAFLDGYFLALDGATATLRISDLFDGLTWDPTQVQQRSAAADPWAAMTVINREIWLMGNQTSEVWYNAGAFPFPFQPIPGAFIEQGTFAPFSPNRDVAPLMWLGHNAQGSGTVVMADGYNARRVSTHGIEQVIQRYGNVADAVSWSYQLIMDVGIGLSGTSETLGFDPQVMRRCSRDGGKTWGPDKWVSAGKLGEYNTRVEWKPCGQARNYVEQFIFTDPVPFRVSDAEIDFTVNGN